MSQSGKQEPRLINLGSNLYAVRFAYHVVTSQTLSLAIPFEFRRDLAKRGLQIGFAPETVETSGSRRADSEEIRKAFPDAVETLSGRVAYPSRYVIFKVTAAPGGGQ